MIVHFHANQYVARAYDQEGTAEELFGVEADWQESMLIQITGRRAFISAAQKDFGMDSERVQMREVFKQTKAFLKSIGMEEMQWHGNGRMQTEKLI